MYVGKGQRMTGEVKRLGKPLGVVRKVSGDGDGDLNMDGEVNEEGELEMVDLVRWKIVFSSRPEPVGAGVEEEA